MDKLFSKAGNNIVEVCSRLMPKETATIVTDKETVKIGEIVKKVADEITNKVNFHVLEDYGERPITFLPKEIKKDVKTTDVTYLAVNSKPGELQKFRGPLVLLAIKSGREIHMPNIDDAIIKSGMQADYYKIASLTFLITGIATKSKTARVTTPKGTDLRVNFSKELKWVPDTGLLWYKGMWGNLPAGEAFTCPENIEGTMVVNGTLGDFFCAKYGNLEETPISIPIKNSRAVVEKIECENKQLLKELKQYLLQDENANRVGEFACGTNITLKNFVGNLLQDEKFPGVHVAFGSPFPEHTGANWRSIGHVDGIMKECSLWFDDIQIIKDGKFKEKELFTLD
ncbi:MAG: aminopeptidase [Candidatus Lokiarchaeota archaeon]|nr:aminopeptidase [Candidatus Lokiarchaeota archaeon]